MRNSAKFAVSVFCAVLAFNCATAIAESAPGAERILWKQQFEGQLWSSPVFDDGALYFGCDDSKFYAFDVEKREIKWSFETNGIVRSRANITDSVVTFASDDGNLYALNQYSGAEVWKFKLGGGLLTRRLPDTTAPYRYDYLCSSPVFSDGLIYIGGANGQLFAIDHASGEERWRFATTESIRSTPLVYNNKVYFGGWDGNLYALDSKSGKLVWSFACGWMIQGSPAVGDGKVIIGSRAAKIVAVNAESGELEWEWKSEEGSWIESSPVVDGAVVYIGTSDALDLMALDLSSGELLWSYETGGWSWYTPTLSGGVVYIGGIAASPYYFEGVVLKAGFYAVDQQTGKEKWRFSPAAIEEYITGGVFASAVVVDGVVYVCSLDGTLYALAE